MQFDITNVKTCVDIETNNIGNLRCGYFSNDLESLRFAVSKNKTTFKAVYGYCKDFLKSNFDKRFCTDYGNFNLFYPADKIMNETRY